MMVSVVFCKQKTAYEMRIRDWSSDVCSSDLNGGVQIIAKRRRKRSFIAGFGTNAGERGPRRRFGNGRKPRDRLAFSPQRRERGPEIGRASWRDRVGQYV